MTISVLPIVNLNGTSSHELLDQHLKVLRALRAARDAINEAAPHGRDYQLNEPRAHNLALADHYGRRVMLDKIIAEYNALAEHFA